MQSNIEALVKKHIDRDGWSLAPDGEVASAIRNALTEQAETHAMELRAYEATVQNLEQRIREIEAQRVPEKVECGCGDIYPASQFMCANCLAAVGAADELRRVDDAQSVPVVGEVVAWRWIRVSTGEPDGGRFFDGTPSDSAIERAVNSYIPCAPQLLIIQPTTSITAAELDALRKDAERYRWLRDPSVYVGKVIDKVAGYEPMTELGTGGYPIYEYRAGPELDDAIDAAIAQGKGE